jgi:ABC-type branched-subunit amino acid transport system ATPase component
MLLLDEPSAGLSPRLVRDLLDKVQQLNDRWDVTVLLVEQNVREALDMSHRAAALVNGKVSQETMDPELWVGEDLEGIFF